MHTVQVLTRLVEHNEVLVYALIFLGILVEGEFILLCTGILVHLGALDLGFALAFVFMGGLCKTFLGYHIGVFIRRKWQNARLLKYIEGHIFSMVPHFEERPFWSIFISKFLMINHLVIVFAGYKKINFKKYLQAEFYSTLLWAPGLLALGYFFSYTAIHISREIWKFTLIVLILIILFIAFDKLVSWIYKMFEEFYHHHPR